MIEKENILFDEYIDELSLLGPMNKNIQLIEKKLNTKIVVSRDSLVIDKKYKEEIINILEVMKTFMANNGSLKEKDVVSIINLLQHYSFDEVNNFFKETYTFISTYDGRLINAKTINQKKYFLTLQHNDIIFVKGSAGSGKTYLAVAYALNLLKKNKIKKIIITRPVVEAGEKLGFLPGDLKEKIDPYLRPIYDAIYDIIGIESANKYFEKEVIEIAPLAYMRGRTMDNAFIILDEAQNTTDGQMKMFLTRLGFNSKMVITGDTSQTDLPSNVSSGLDRACKMLHDLEGIGIVTLENIDVMRHPLVSEIIKVYEENTNDKK